MNAHLQAAVAIYERSVAEIIRSAHDWATDHEELMAFARALVSTGDFRNATSMLEFFEAPWKWTDEYDCWVYLGRPAKLEEVGDLQGWLPIDRDCPREIVNRYVEVDGETCT